MPLFQKQTPLSFAEGESSIESAVLLSGQVLKSAVSLPCSHKISPLLAENTIIIEK